MTECEKLHNDLKAFLDGQLSPAARIAMRLHLNRCASCRKEIEEMRLLGTSMRASDSLEMSEALRSRILASVPTAAPDAKVPMIPKWREKPVLIWGASASALMAWFVLYPAIDNYQRHASRSATIVSNNTQMTQAMQSYSQDYDQPNDGEVNKEAKYSVSFYADGKNDVSDTAGTENQKRTPKLPSANGLPPLIGNGNGNNNPSNNPGHGVLRYAYPRKFDLTRTDAYQDRGLNPRNSLPFAEGHASYKIGADVLAGGRRVDAGETVHVGRESADRRYTALSQQLLAEGTRNLHTIRGTLKPSEMVENGLAKSRQQEHKVYSPASSVLDDLPTERQVHKEANLTVEVANAEQQSESVERLVKESKGYVAQNQLSTVEDNTRQATLTCKVPVDQFDAVMGQLARLGLLKGKTLSGEDITEKVSDEQETGHVLRADIVTTEEKLKVRKRHSETVRDEETLRQLRIRVAQSQARLKMLTRLGALSEITVELDEKPKNAAPQTVKPANPFMEEMGSTGQAAAHSFLMALRLPVQLLVWIVVYSPLWALLIFGYRRMTR